MTFSTPKLDNAVQEFKNLFNNHKELFLFGQFYLHNRYFDQLIAEFKSIMQANPFFLVNPQLLEPQLELIKKFLSLPANQLTEQNINNFFNTIDPTGIFTSSVRPILSPGSADLEAVKQDYTMVWSSPEIGNAPPYLGVSSFPKYLASFKYEKDKCFDTCRSFTRKLLKARGITTIPANAKISDGAIAQATVKRSFRDPASGVVSDVIVYGAPTALSNILTKIKAAIDAKCVVQCGVLSGLFHEHSSFPTPEHYILIFGYDTVGGKDMFLFWDPDAVRSNIASTTWGRGFGCLFFESGRFSTAINNNDLFNIEVASNEFFGDHLSEPVRHRYQVYYLQTLPL